ncbi:hypothetical protein A9168_10490 [Macellibacteroides sp. HH-ZS]|nr:hypothetical protein A9168_10490 [Macellibacteroides sp. HH-ZS]
MYHSSKLKCRFLGALGQQQIMRFKTVQKKTLNGIMQINSLLRKFTDRLYSRPNFPELIDAT